jgi:hypothetical protein
LKKSYTVPSLANIPPIIGDDSPIKKQWNIDYRCDYARQDPEIWRYWPYWRHKKGSLHFVGWRLVEILMIAPLRHNLIAVMGIQKVEKIGLAVILGYSGHL